MAEFFFALTSDVDVATVEALTAQCAAYAALAQSAQAAADADVVLTHADVVSTHADVVSTHADVVLTHADVLLTHADVTSAGGSATAAAASAAAAAASAASITLPIPIASGGTGQTTAALARTALGLAIGTDVQAHSADLDLWAVVTPSSYLTTTSAASTYLTISSAASTYETISAAAAAYQPLDADLTAIAALSTTTFGRAFLTQASAATTQSTLGLVIGTNVQAFDTDLTTWAGITPATGVGTFLAGPSSANLKAAVTDETGSGALVFGTAPTLNQPVHMGVTNGGNAAAGELGEFIQSIVASTSPVSIPTSGTPANITSIALTAGDWEVSGTVGIASSTSVVALFSCGVSATSATSALEQDSNRVGLGSGSFQSPARFACPTVRFSLSAGATAFLVVTAVFSGGTTTAFGEIRARRVR